MKKKRYFSRTVIVLLAILFAFLFVMPTLLTITNSFMTQSALSCRATKPSSLWKRRKSRIRSS